MNEPVSLIVLQRAAASVLRKEGRGGLRVQIVFVGPTEIQRLNRVYRKKNYVTDVLSFRELDEGPFADVDYLGEIVLCRSKIRTQAREYEVSYREELLRMTVHGTLHLLGYDHIKPRDARVMLPRQEAYLGTIIGRRA